jgi:phospholipid transport system transporter-binding protein
LNKLNWRRSQRTLLNSTVHTAAFEIQEGERSRVNGVLHFTTVTSLLSEGSEAIGNGRAAVIDLAGVKDSDSSGLALLIEWLSIAKASSRSLHYENIPAQLQQLAHLSDVEELLAVS